MTCFTVLFTCIDPHTWPGLHPHRLQKTVCPIISMSAAPDRVTHHSIVPRWHPSHWIKTCHLEARLSSAGPQAGKSPNTGVDADILLLVPANIGLLRFFFSTACFAGHYAWRCGEISVLRCFSACQQNSLRLVVMAVTWPVAHSTWTGPALSNTFIRVAVSLHLKSRLFPHWCWQRGGMQLKSDIHSPDLQRMLGKQPPREFC